MKLLLLLLLSWSVLATIAVYFLQEDDPLLPEIGHFMELIPQGSESQAYLFLMGAKAGMGEDPIEYGRTVYHQYMANKEMPDEKTMDDYQIKYPKDDMLFCRGWKDSCLKNIFEYSKSAQNIISEYSKYRPMFKQFTQFDDYITMTQPDIAEPFPNFQFVSIASRLILLESIQQFRSGNVDQAINELMGNLKDLKRFYEQQDNLIGKMVAVVLMSEHLDFITILSTKSGKNPPYIPPLNFDSRGLDRVFAREFAMGFYLFTSLDKQPRFFSDDGNLPGWFVRLFYKPNMTINADFPIYKQYSDDSKLGHQLFSTIDFKADMHQTEQSWVRNSAGIALNRVSHPDFYEYIGRVLDLEAKFLLYDQYRKSVETDVRLSKVLNPYYDGEFDRFQDDPGKLCLDGPIEDKRNLRCLTYDL